MAAPRFVPRVNTQAHNPHQDNQAFPFSDKQAAAVAGSSALIADAATNQSDYDAWRDQFAGMFKAGGEEYLAERLGLSFGLAMGTRVAIMPFIQAGIAALGITRGMLPFVLTTVGMSLATSSALTVYNYFKTPEAMRSDMSIADQFLTTFAYSLPAVMLGMGASQAAMARLAPTVSVFKRGLVDFGVDFISEPLQAVTALGVYQYFLKGRGLDITNMNTWQRFKMELAEGYFGLGSARAANGALHVAPRPVQRVTNAISNASAKAGHQLGSALNNGLDATPGAVHAMASKALEHGDAAMAKALQMSGIDPNQLGGPTAPLAMAAAGSAATQAATAPTPSKGPLTFFRDAGDVDAAVAKVKPYEVTPAELARQDASSETPRLSLQEGVLIRQITDLSRVFSPLEAIHEAHQDWGKLHTITSDSTNENIDRVAITGFSAEDFIRALQDDPQREHQILSSLFTAQELNDDNLGVYRNAVSKTKYYSRLAGLLAMKAAIFKAAGLPLPSEDVGGQGPSLSWTDITYARQSYDDNGTTRYHRVRELKGEVAARLEGKGLLTSSTDEGYVGQAVAVVERSPGASGFVGMGLDITDVNRRAFGGDEAAAVRHARGEAVYKATYYGGQQPFYLHNIAAEVRQSTSPQQATDKGEPLTLTGISQRAMQNLGGEEAKAQAATFQHGAMVTSLALIEGKPTNLDLHKIGTVNAPNTETTVRPALAQLIDNGDVNLIVQFPGQASDFATYLLTQYQTNARARKIVDERLPILRAEGIPVDRLMRGELTPDEIADVRMSLPLIGIASEVAAAELTHMGYDLRKARATIGHSQGTTAALQALGGITPAAAIETLAKSGPLMAADGEEYRPAVGETMTLAELGRLKSNEQLEAMKDYSGKIAMIATLGMPRDELAQIIREVNDDPEMQADGQRAAISLVNTDFSKALQAEGPEGIQLSTDPATNGINVSGSKKALIKVAERVAEQGKKVRVIPATGAYHSPLLEGSFWNALERLADQKIGDLPGALIMHDDGVDLRTIRERGWVKASDDPSKQIPIDDDGTVTVTSPQGKTITAQAETYEVVRNLFVGQVDWPLTCHRAMQQCDPNKPTIVIGFEPGDTVSKMTRKNFTDAHGRPTATILSMADTSELQLLRSGQWEDVALMGLPTVERLTDPRFQPQPVLQQVKEHAPMIDGEYVGPHRYLSDLVLADPEMRADFIQRAERALNGEDGMRSEFLEKLGFDSEMPLVLAAMTGNNRAELVSTMAAERYLGFFATSTVNTIEKVHAEFNEIHRLTQQKLKAKGDPKWEDGAPFGANVIHGTPFYKPQVQAIADAIDRGIPIKAVSIAFSQISVDDWVDVYLPLLKRGVTLIPLTETEKRWHHFTNNLLPETPDEYRHLLAIAPESGEGGGHNKRWFNDDGSPSGTIRFGYQLTQSLLKDPPEVPWLMTGGQSSATAIADAALVMALEGNRGGMQVGGIMQLSKEAAWPPQIKEFIAEAAAGKVEFAQIVSEFDRSINCLRNKFTDNMQALEEALKGVEEIDADDGQGGTKRVQQAIGTERAEAVAKIFETESDDQIRVLQRLWNEGMTDTNRHIYEPLLDVFDIRLSHDHQALVDRLAGCTPREVIGCFRSYRTWSILEADIDPDYAYVLGGRSIRSMGQWLESMGRDPRHYLNMSAPEIFRDLRDCAQDYLRSVLAQAKEMEAADQARKAEMKAAAHEALLAKNYAALDGFVLRSLSDLASVEGVRAEADDTFKIGRKVSTEVWLDNLTSVGRGALAHVLRSETTATNSKFNPIRRALLPETGDTVKVTLDTKSADEPILSAIEVTNKAGEVEVSLRLDEGQQTVVETWHAPQPDGGAPSTIQLYHHIEATDKANFTVASSKADHTVADGNRAYTDLWVGRGHTHTGQLGDVVAGKTLTVDEFTVKQWNSEIGAISRPYQVSRRTGGVVVHPSFALKAAWSSIVEAGGHPDVGISYMDVVHSGQIKRSGAAIAKGDTLTSESRVVRVENNDFGREATIFTQVRNQDGALVAEYETKFLGRGEQLKTEEFSQDYIPQLAPQGPVYEVNPRPMYQSAQPFSVSADDMRGYSLDAQWLHSHDRYARRFGPSDQGIIAQGWLLFHRMEHELAEGHLGNQNLGRLIGFGDGTVVQKPVLADEKLVVEADLQAIQGDRALLQVTLADTDDRVRAAGVYETKLPGHLGVFPGNASQKIGMAKDLLDNGHTQAKAILAEALTAVSETIDTNRLATALWGEPAELKDGAIVKVTEDADDYARLKASLEGDEAQWLNHAERSSVAVFATSVALQKASGFQPTKVAGHSLGQYTAAAVAGAYSVTEGARLVAERGRLLVEHASGKMAAIVKKGPLDLDALKTQLAEIKEDGEELNLGNKNFLTDRRSQVVITGDEAAVQRASEVLGKEKGLRAIVLPGNVAFHSPKVENMQPSFGRALDAVTISDPRIPLVSIVNPGKLLTTAEEVKAELLGLNPRPVEWDGAMRSLTDDGDTPNVIEYADSNTLTRFVETISPDKNANNLNGKPADELFFGKRPQPRQTPAPTPQTEAAPAAKPAAPAAVEAPRAVETPALPVARDLNHVDLLALELDLTATRVDFDRNSGVIKSATPSPLARPENMTPAQFLWHNTVLSMCEMSPDLKPGDITPDMSINKLGFDSLEVAGLYGLVRNRSGIQPLPTEGEVKAIQDGSVAELFNTAADYWNKQFNETPTLTDRHDVTGLLAADDKALNYKDLLSKHEASGKLAFDLISSGKINADTPGIELLTRPLQDAGEGALAAVEGHLDRVAKWEFDSEHFGKEGVRLRDVKTALFNQAKADWEQQKAANQAQRQQAQLALATSAPARAAAAVEITPPPASLTHVDLLALELDLTATRVNFDRDSGVIKAATPSPLTRPETMTPAQFLWHNTVLSMCEMSPDLKPGDITPDMSINKLGFDSLEVAGLYGLVRNRSGIQPLPTEGEVKAIQDGSVAELFNTAADYWNKQFNETPILTDRHDVTGLLAADDKALNYKDLLSKHGASGKLAFDLISSGKINADTPGIELLTRPLQDAGEGALAAVEGHLDRVAKWEFDSEHFGKEGVRLRDVKTALFNQAKADWEQQRVAREASNQVSAPVAEAPMVAGLLATQPGVGADQVRALVDEAVQARLEDLAPVTAKEGMAREVQAVVFDTVDGRLKPADQIAGDAAQKTLARVTENAGDDFTAMMAQRWSGRQHQPWGEVHQNGAPQKAFLLFQQLMRGDMVFDATVRPEGGEELLRWEQNDAAIDRFANQADERVIEILLTLAQKARSQGKDDVAQTVDYMVSRVERSLELQAETGHGIPAKVRTDSTRFRADYGNPDKVVKESRGLSGAERLARLSEIEAADPRILKSIERLQNGEIDNTGNLAIILGATGTIAQPAAERFLQTGAHVWGTTRRDFGGIEHTARAMRNENATRWNDLRFATGWVPNKDNSERLAAQIVQAIKNGEMGDLDRLTFINGMAADDYGPITKVDQWHKVMQVILGAEKEFMAALIKEMKEEGIELPIHVINIASPNVKFMLEMSNSYCEAKAARLPEKQLASRREVEGLYYKDGTPMVVDRTVVTGAVPPNKNEGVMRYFRENADALEQASQERGVPIWVFAPEDYGDVVVAMADPRHGNKDLYLNSDGNLEKANIEFSTPGAKASAIQNGVAQLQKQVAAAESAKHTEAKDAWKQAQSAKEQNWHPFVNGRLRDVLDMGFHIDEVDGNRALSPYGNIADDDIVVVGMGSLTALGVHAIDNLTTPVEHIGGAKDVAWPMHVGLRYLAPALGHNVTGKPFGEVAAELGRDLYAGLGPKTLNKAGDRSDAYTQYESFRGNDRVELGSVAEINAAASATKGAGVKLREQIARYERSGYQFQIEGDLVVATKQDTEMRREVTGQVRPRLWAHTPDIDFLAQGSYKPWVNNGAEHISMTAWSTGAAYYAAGITPMGMTQKHGPDQVAAMFSYGLGSGELSGSQFQSSKLDQSPGQFDIVFGIGGAAAGQAQAIVTGGRGPTLEIVNACNTGPATVDAAIKHLQAGFAKAKAIPKQIAEAEARGASKAEIKALGAEFNRALGKARNQVIVTASGDNSGVVETAALFDRVGAMIRHEEAQAREFPDSRQQRPHDKASLKKFQGGDGAGTLLITTGYAMKEHGYTPLAVFRASQVGGDGARTGPDGKARAATGIGRFGQEHVFFEALRQSRTRGVPPESIEQMNSHSTGTGSDPVQSQSFLIARAMESLDWAAKQLAFAPEEASEKYGAIVDLLKEKEVTAMDLVRTEPNEGGQLRKLGFSYFEPETFVKELLDLPSKLREQLGLSATLIENHIKGVGKRHTLGGTIIELVDAIMQVTHSRTMPNPGLNNLIDATAHNPTAHTLPDSIDTTGIHTSLARYDQVPAEVPAGTKGFGQNSFGFNGLDGFIVGEVPRGMNFETKEEAVKWWTAQIRNEATAIAMDRAREAGDMNSILQSKDEGVTAEAYTDTKEGFDNAEDLATRIVNRESGIRMPWESTWEKLYNASSNGEEAN